MSETRQHDYPFYRKGKWYFHPCNRGSRMQYLQAYHKSLYEKKMSLIETLATCAREGGKRRRLGWGLMLDQKFRRREL